MTDTGFGADDGSADVNLLAALRNPDDETNLMRVLSTARLLVPIVAAPTEVVHEGALTADKSADMAVATLVSPEGMRALPVFSGMPELQAWDPAARPSPVTSARAAQAAISERCDVMVVDLAGPSPVTLRPSMVWALATGRDWQPAYLDGHVRAAVEAAVRDEPDVASAECEAGENGALRVVLFVRDGLDSAALQGIAQRVGERIATDGETRARIDALTFAIRPTPAKRH
ncbi:SseB family protein [Metallococcus carri]|uniref:SseB family protein n=1 Tax=Metallococcus carri TaxID=1656884 RepID=UPI002E2B326C|nr:SseB family protein [Metallococcus carri]